jgi:glucose/mannose transport system permease protein
MNRSPAAATLTGRPQRQLERRRRTLVSWLGPAGAGLIFVPPLVLGAAYVVAFTLWTVVLSFTHSTLVPQYIWAGWHNYKMVLSSGAWNVAYINLIIYGAGFVSLTTALGLFLAVLLDQRIRGENVFRTIFLYPMAVSFVVTGTVWAWLLDPAIGIEHLVRSLGWANFHFDWIVNREMSIFTVVMAAVWQATGFAMVLFLAGLQSVNPELLKAAEIDGAGTWTMYRRVVLPSIAPTVISVLVVLLQFALKTFDLVIALTSGGPGLSSTLPTVVLYDFVFQRGLIGRGSAAAVLLLLTVVVVIGPYLAYMRWRDWKGRSVA